MVYARDASWSPYAKSGVYHWAGKDGDGFSACGQVSLLDDMPFEPGVMRHAGCRASGCRQRWAAWREGKTFSEPEPKGPRMRNRRKSHGRRRVEKDEFCSECGALKEKK